MVIDKNTLPDDPALLKKMLLELSNEHLQLNEEHSQLSEQLTSLKEKLKYFQRMFFGWSFSFASLLAQATRVAKVKNSHLKS